MSGRFHSPSTSERGKVSGVVGSRSHSESSDETCRTFLLAVDPLGYES